MLILSGPPNVVLKASETPLAFGKARLIKSKDSFRANIALFAGQLNRQMKLRVLRFQWRDLHFRFSSKPDFELVCRQLHCQIKLVEKQKIPAIVI